MLTMIRSSALLRGGTRGALLTLAAVTALAALACDDYDDDGYDGGNPTAPPPVGPQPTLIARATGDSGAIAAKLNEFRAAIGEPNNGGTAGQQAAGRREISWDGAGANPFNNRNDFPAAFFNTNARNGVVFTTPGTGFRNDSLRFAEVEPTYAGQFDTFSPTKIFSPVGSSIMDVHFQVAGSPTAALVSGFGVIFSDVDREGSAKLELFDRTGKSLGVFNAPARSDARGLTFLGVKFEQSIVARVRITAGTGALAPGVRDLSAGGTLDLVVVDHFIYGEPKAIE
jgi:hypothetical protein